jgi:hypothetical protein
MKHLPKINNNSRAIAPTSTQTGGCAEHPPEEAIAQGFAVSTQRSTELTPKSERGSAAGNRLQQFSGH